MEKKELEINGQALEMIKSSMLGDKTIAAIINTAVQYAELPKANYELELTLKLKVQDERKN